MVELKIKWHEFWESYHYNWLIKSHGKFPDRPRHELSLLVRLHAERYWHHRNLLP